MRQFLVINSHFEAKLIFLSSKIGRFGPESGYLRLFSRLTQYATFGTVQTHAKIFPIDVPLGGGPNPATSRQFLAKNRHLEAKLVFLTLPTLMIITLETLLDI